MGTMVVKDASVSCPRLVGAVVGRSFCFQRVERGLVGTKKSRIARPSDHDQPSIGASPPSSLVSVAYTVKQHVLLPLVDGTRSGLKFVTLP